MMPEFRAFAADELGADGYPAAWHETLKHAVREAAGHRCVRCLHPYVQGAGEWSPCDEQCTHAGEARERTLLAINRFELAFDPWADHGVAAPYVAGYYAWVYLREDLTREQVDERLGELLALERA